MSDKDTIYRQDAIDAIHEDADWLAAQGSDWQAERMERDKSILMSLPSAEKVQLSGEDATFDCISRQAVLDLPIKRDICWFDGSVDEWINVEDIKELPSVQQCMTATSNTMVSETVKIPVMDGTTERLPSAQPETPPYIAEIESEYKKWVSMPSINKPLAKALYEVWKKHDREDVRRNG